MWGRWWWSIRVIFSPDNRWLDFRVLIWSAPTGRRFFLPDQNKKRRQVTPKILLNAEISRDLYSPSRLCRDDYPLAGRSRIGQLFQTRRRSFSFRRSAHRQRAHSTRRRFAGRDRDAGLATD